MPEPNAFAQGVPDVFITAFMEQLGAQAGVGLRRHPDARRGRPVVGAGDVISTARNSTRGQAGKREARLFLVEEELLRVEGEAVLGPAVQGTLAHAGKTAARLFQQRRRILDHHARLRRKVVEEGSETGMKDGNQRLTAEEILALFDLLQQVAGLARRVGGLVGGGQQTRPHIRAGGDHSLPHRVERHSVNGPQAALGGGVVQAQRLHLVAKQLDAYRVLVDRGKHVDDSPAYSEGSGILDYLRPAVAGSA